MPAIQYKDLLIDFTTEFVPLWNDKGTRADAPVTFWRPSTASSALANFTALGDVASGSYANINQQKMVAVVSDTDPVNGTALRAPNDFELIWKHTGPRARTDFSLWRPVAPEGYVAMGDVCGVGNDKPPRNTVRCIRADLVHTSRAGKMIWNDKGSGALANFSVWATALCETVAGEVCFTPGTFKGVDSHTGPDPQVPAYVLRAELGMRRSPLPAPPEQIELLQTESVSAEHTTYACDLPWFVVKDEKLIPTEQLHMSPYYRLERRDHYQLVGAGHNPSANGKAFTWTLTKGEKGSGAGRLAQVTGVELIREWSSPQYASPVGFGVQLDRDFTHSAESAQGWSNPTALDVVAYVPGSKAILAYVRQSEFHLLRADGSPLADTVYYTDGEQVYYSELLAPHALIPPTEEHSTATLDTPETQAPSEVTPHDVTDDTLLA